MILRELHAQNRYCLHGKFGISSRFSSLLFTVTSTALSWDLNFFKNTQPLTVSRVWLPYTVKEKGGKPERKPYPLPYGLRNPYRKLKSENSQDYAPKTQRNCTFMNSASVLHLTLPALCAILSSLTNIFTWYMILLCTILFTRMCNYVTDMNIYQISANKNNLHNLQMSSIRMSGALRLGLFWVAL